MIEIPEYSRDSSKDYLRILEALKEIPFPVGKILLSDFLKGEESNKSIEKNELYELESFGNLSFLPKEEIILLIENILYNKLAEIKSSTFNQFVKVIELTERGKKELITPLHNEKKLEISKEEKEEFNEREIEAFKELHDFLLNFNMDQKRAIIDSSSKILCIAGAGAGKTTVLTKRIEFLNKYKKIRGDEILAITFTRKAREEMQRRLEKIGVKTNVETFNSFCEKILLKNGGKIYGRKVRLAGYSEKMILFLSALDYLGLDLPKAIDKYFNLNQKKNKTFQQLQNILMNDCFSVLDYIKIKGKEISEVKSDLKDNSDYKMIYEIVNFLRKQMEIQGLRTYADQMQDAILFFKKYPKQIPKFQHILVDEYQDVNSSQVELLDLLSPNNLFAVGDPRQAIFGWRGADIRFILDFKKKHEDARIIHLTKNYRSNEHIVSLMNKIISNMKMPNLEANFRGERFLALKKFDSEEEELDFIVNNIKNMEISLKEIFVLARTNRQLEALARIFKKESIPYILKTEENPEIESKGELTLATIHSIKGLEAEIVFLIGANSINFPCKSSEHPVIEEIKMYDYDKEEEERRLFYVAVSRAKNKLILTYSGKKPTYFLNEKDFY